MKKGTTNNATKYTIEYVTEQLTTMVKDLKADGSIVYLWELFIDKDYTKQRFHEWAKDYPKDEVICRLSVTIKDILETRAVKWAMTGSLNANFTSFHLKNNYNWKDKIENINTNTNLNKDMWELSEEELQDIINNKS